MVLAKSSGHQIISLFKFSLKVYDLLNWTSQSFKDLHVLLRNFSLRPLTPGKCFLLFLPDSHSAYYDSFVSALGWSLPPHWVFQGFVVLGPVSGGNGGWGGGVGGGITHPRLQHWVKWLWE